MREAKRSAEAFKRARAVIAGGVNSPVRAFTGVGGTPVFAASGHGPRLRDIDGNTYIDLVCSWGPLLHGHAHPRIVEAVCRAARDGTSFGLPTRMETELAERIVAAVPSVDRLRLVSSGTEATMSAVRLARGATGRDLVVKFEGCYHGHGDAFLIAAGSGATTLGIPSSPGVTRGTAEGTLLARYNDKDSVAELFHRHGDAIAALIVEPVAGNMGVIPPAEGFLAWLREITGKHGALLIFDEVITGFRVAPGGAQQYYEVTPDLTTLGKIIGGGLPVGAYGGRADIMDRLAPTGPVYQAGTLSGNPAAVAAGLAMLEVIDETPGLYETLDARGAALEQGLREGCGAVDVPAVVNRVGSMMTCFFTSDPAVTDYESARKSDTQRYARFFHEALDNGLYPAPSQFEAAFVSSSHTDDDIARAVDAARRALACCAEDEEKSE